MQIRGEVPHENIRIDRFPLLSVPGDKGFNNFVFPNMYRMWRRIREISPDVIHVHCPSFFGFIGVVIAKRLHIPSVYTAHMFTEYFTSGMNPRFRPIGIRFFDMLLKKYMGLFRAVVYPSEMRKNKTLRSYGLENRAIAISNGYIFKKNVPVFSRQNAWHDKMVFFTVSRLSPEKNIRLVIDAFRKACDKNPDILLCIVGDGVMREQLEQYAKTSEFASRIEFVGQKLGDDLEYYYVEGDVFVSASDHESEGLTVLEAISHGKPIILSSSPGNAAQQFLQENGYLFNAGDSDDLASKILEISDDRDRIHTMQKKSREKSQEYDFSHSLAAYRQFYPSLLKQSHD